MIHIYNPATLEGTGRGQVQAESGQFRAFERPSQKKKNRGKYSLEQRL